MDLVHELMTVRSIECIALVCARTGGSGAARLGPAAQKVVAPGSRQLPLMLRVLNATDALCCIDSMPPLSPAVSSGSLTAAVGSGVATTPTTPRPTRSEGVQNSTHYGSMLTSTPGLSGFALVKPSPVSFPPCTLVIGGSLAVRGHATNSLELSLSAIRYDHVYFGPPMHPICIPEAQSSAQRPAPNVPLQ